MGVVADPQRLHLPIHRVGLTVTLTRSACRQEWPSRLLVNPLTHFKRTSAIPWTVTVLARVAKSAQMLAQATAQGTANPAKVGARELYYLFLVFSDRLQM